MDPVVGRGGLPRAGENEAAPRGAGLPATFDGGVGLPATFDGGAGLPAPRGGDRVLTIPNALSVLRLLLVPVFLYLLLGAHAIGWAVAVLMFSGFSDWADGKIARLVANQSSRLGALLDPAVDRVYMVVVPIGLAIAHVVPWWIVLTMIGRDVLLAATLPILRSRGLTALPVSYIGKAATFSLMSGLPLILLGQFDALWSRIILACGWAFLIWGLAMYLWSGVLYLIQIALVARQMPPRRAAKTAPRVAGK